MIGPAAIAPWAALVARDRDWRADTGWRCGMPAPDGRCDVLAACCRLPHDPLRFTRRFALAAATCAPWAHGWLTDLRSRA